MKYTKDQLLQKLRTHISYIREKVLESRGPVSVVANRSLREIGKMRPEDQVVEMERKGFAIRRVEELDHLYKTPYFIKCEIVDPDSGEKKEYFFAKHQLSDESIYSWVSPIAAIRFESPGVASYTLPSGEKKELALEAREQYMIVDGKVLFFAREERGTPRELIYQEHFTKQKSGFVLPEIVAQMEKAQDTVIRAHHFGPLVISGPAGSGKTTLALHRVAYLTQAPDTASFYKPEKSIVFVQDDGTKEYFSHLLPELGIHNVTITTFSSWAMSILGVSSFRFVHRYGADDEERDMYEYHKIKVLRATELLPEYDKNPFVFLSKLYGKFPLFEKQQQEKVLDRFDLTILLRSYVQRYKKIEKTKVFEGVVDGVFKKKRKKTLLEYALIVVDEFQNYLPEQLLLFRSCIAKETNAMMYVGDTAQQVYLGTIKEWSQIKETISTERSIRLDKVYRNTRNILLFIESLGYQISIPKGIKEGPVVTEEILSSQEEEIQHIQSALARYREGSVGIIAKTDTYLRPFKKAFRDDARVHVLTMNESQGVEFDLVCLVGIAEDTFTVTHHSDVLPEHIQERGRMQRDLLYVALTRAITELHVLGTKRLKDISF